MRTKRPNVAVARSALLAASICFSIVEYTVIPIDPDEGNIRAALSKEHAIFYAAGAEPPLAPLQQVVGGEAICVLRLWREVTPVSDLDSNIIGLMDCCLGPMLRQNVLSRLYRIFVRCAEFDLQIISEPMCKLAASNVSRRLRHVEGWANEKGKGNIRRKTDDRDDP